MPPCCKAYRCKASSVPYASLLQGLLPWKMYGLVWSVFYTPTVSLRQLRMVRDPERNLAPWSGGLVLSVFYTQPSTRCPHALPPRAVPTACPHGLPPRAAPTRCLHALPSWDLQFQLPTALHRVRISSNSYDLSLYGYSKRGGAIRDTCPSHIHLKKLGRGTQSDLYCLS